MTNVIDSSKLNPAPSTSKGLLLPFLSLQDPQQPQPSQTMLDTVSSLKAIGTLPKDTETVYDNNPAVDDFIDTNLYKATFTLRPGVNGLIKDIISLAYL